MTDVRLTALNPVDSQVYPVACNTSGELIVEQVDPGPDLTVTGDLTIDGTTSISSGSPSTPSLIFGTDTDTGILSPGANQLAITTNGTQRVTVDSSGAVGIGRTPVNNNAGYNLQLRGSASQTYLQLSTATQGDTLGDGLVIGIDNSNANIIQRENAPLHFFTNNTKRVTFDSSGNVYIGGTSAATADIALNADGTATFQGNVTAPNINSLNTLVNDLQAKMSLILRQIDISAETP